MPRLFVAARPPAPVREALLALMEGVGGARWQDDEQLHLTLRFAGEVDRHGAEALAAALAGLSFAPFPLRLAGAGCFDRRGGGAALWAGVERSEALLHLQRKVERACAASGLPPERKTFHPHVTLARMRSLGEDARAFVARHAGLASAPFVVDAFGLFESRLGSGGASYSMAVRYPADAA